MSEPLARIFLLSHMRAYTSLAGHILGSHPAINGYYEMHLGYDGIAALERQLDEYRKHESLKRHSRYLFDKLLHNRYRLETDRLAPVPLKLLVALREPEASLKSIVRLFAQKPTAEAYASPEAAGDYLIARLEWLAGFCRTHEGEYDYYDAELFRADPGRLLAALSLWLELETPLNERYQRFSQTGKARKGDSSAFIHSGRIETRASGGQDVAIPSPIIERARQVYCDCRQAIVDNARRTLTV